MTTGGTSQSSAPARRWVLALASVASLMVVLDALVVSTALNTIRVHLGATSPTGSWSFRWLSPTQASRWPHPPPRVRS